MNKETPWAWDEEVDMEFRLARSILSADQPYSITPSTPVGKDAETPADDNGYNPAHRPCTDSNQNPIPTNTQADHPYPPTPSSEQQDTTQAPSTQEA